MDRMSAEIAKLSNGIYDRSHSFGQSLVGIVLIEQSTYLIIQIAPRVPFEVQELLEAPSGKCCGGLWAQLQHSHSFIIVLSNVCWNLSWGASCLTPGRVDPLGGTVRI